MSRFSTFTTFVFFLTVFSTSAVTVTENTAKKLTFLFDIGTYRISSDTIGDRIYTRLSFPGATTIRTNGGFLHPAQTLRFGVPPLGHATVRFIPHEVKQIVLKNPLRKNVTRESGGKQKATAPMSPWISNLYYSHFRDLRTGHVYITPFLYDSSSQTLTILINGSCTIDFPPSTRSPVSVKDYSNDYYAMVDGLVLNFPIAKYWIKSSRRKHLSKKGQFDLSPYEKMLKFSIGDGNSGVNEATCRENGIIKFNPKDVSYLSNSDLTIESIVLLGSRKKELSFRVPDVGQIPHGYTEIPLLKYDRNNDGYFNGNDYILAYVTGLSDWYFDSTKNDYAFTLNHFDNYRHYWLKKGGSGKQIKPFIPPQIPATLISSFETRQRFQKSHDLMWDGTVKPYGGYDWIWSRLFNRNKQMNYTLDIEDPDSSFPGYLRLGGRGVISWDCSLFVTLGDSLLQDSSFWYRFDDFRNLKTNIEFYNPGDNDFYQLQYFEVKYHKKLDMTGKQQLRIFSPLESGLTVAYGLQNVPKTRTLILRIAPDENRVSLVADTVCTTGFLTWTDTAGMGIQYFVCSDAGFLPSPSLKPFKPKNKMSNNDFIINDLRMGVNSADYLIITHQNFKNEALRLAKHKKSMGTFFNPRVVDIDDIYREFAGGNGDIGTIRNFLLYTHNSLNWSIKPDYVLLVGIGHYDYKNYTSSKPQFIPTAQLGFNCIDDFFGCLNPGEFILDADSVAPDIFIGRITCKTNEEMKNVVDKIIETEGPDADFGSWRNRLLLISDDDIQVDGKDYINHHYGNEDIEDSVKIMRPSLEIRKVYLFEYELNDVYEKPGASKALFDEINRGVAWVNYFGHANHSTVADEKILTRDKLIHFHNKNRYPIINAFSCSVGRFDNPDIVCLGSQLVVMPQAGALATVSASRIAYASGNTIMAKIFFSQLFDKKTSLTLGHAFAKTKAMDGGNIRYYNLIGDPSVQFNAISDSVEFRVLAENGTEIIDTLQALQTLLIKGNITRNKSINTLFGSIDNPAFVQIGLFNPQQENVQRKDGITYSKPIYSMPGSPLFFAVVKVVKGQFQQKIGLPKRVQFDKPGVRLTTYAWHGQKRATGGRSNFIFHGTCSTKVADTKGPRIAVRPVYDSDSSWNTSTSFVDNIKTVLPATLEINVWDESGIDVTGTAPDEGLTFEIKKALKRRNINHQFVFDDGEYIKGHTNLTIEKNTLPPGDYDMLIKAQDLYGNISELLLDLEILSLDDFSLSHVFNHPNPVRMGQSTKFYFYHSNTSNKFYKNVTVTLKIFTLSGKLVRRIITKTNGYKWDLTDQRGAQLPPNVYLYRVYVTTQHSEFEYRSNRVTSPVKKIVIHPPR